MLIFVYGTLKEKCCNHGVLKKFNIDSPTPVTTAKKYPMYKSDSYFPYLENQPGVGQRIHGELYEIHDKYEEKLDDFEGVPDLYKKGKISVMLQGGTILNDINCYFRKDETNVSDKRLIGEWVESKYESNKRKQNNPERFKN